MLIRCLKGMAHFDCNLEFIIHDFGSTDAATRNLLDQLESQGIRVYRCAAIHSPDQLDRASQTVEHFFAHYKDLEPGKWTKLKGWQDADVAKKMIMEGVERANAAGFGYQGS